MIGGGGGGGDIGERPIAFFSLLSISTLIFSAIEVPVAASAFGSTAVDPAALRCCLAVIDVVVSIHLVWSLQSPSVHDGVGRTPLD